VGWGSLLLPQPSFVHMLSPPGKAELQDCRCKGSVGKVLLKDQRSLLLWGDASPEEPSETNPVTLCDLQILQLAAGGSEDQEVSTGRAETMYMQVQLRGTRGPWALGKFGCFLQDWSVSWHQATLRVPTPCPT